MVVHKGVISIPWNSNGSACGFALLEKGRSLILVDSVLLPPPPLLRLLSALLLLLAYTVKIVGGSKTDGEWEGAQGGVGSVALAMAVLVLFFAGLYYMLVEMAGEAE